MEYALPAAWGIGRRGFWTKRKRTLTALLAVLALLAGLAVAFKLFERQVPNNVVRDASNFSFRVQVFSPPPGGGTPRFQEAGPPPDGVPIFDDAEQFPGDKRTKLVRILNTNTNPAKDASFSMYVDQASIVVRDCVLGPDPTDPSRVICTQQNVVPVNDPNWAKFVGFWTLTVNREKVLFIDDLTEVNENDHGLVSGTNGRGRRPFTQYDEACSGGLRELTPNSPCNLGMVRANGSSDLLGQDTDIRYYEFIMSEQDDGTDQSAFKGWSITWTFVFQARVPALEETSAPVGER